MNECYPSIRSTLLPIHPLDTSRSEATGEGSVSADSVLADRDPLYLHIEQNVRCKRLSALAGGHRPKRAAMSPDTPPATTVGEPGIFAVVTHDRTVAGSRSHEQGRLP
jgi:hypothetical protein